MPKFKRSLSLLLVLSLLLFAGCGKEEDLTEQMELDDEVYEDYDDYEDEYDDDDDDGEYGYYEGWWVRSGYYEPDGISLVDNFYVDSVNGTYTIYNNYGDELDTYDCYFDDDILTLDLSFDLVDFYYEDGALYNTETGEQEYLHVVDPGFETPSVSTGSIDGCWYRLGDDTGETYYYLSGSNYEKAEYGVLVDQGRFTSSDVTVYVNDYTPGTVLTLDLSSDQADLVPSADGTMLFEDTDFDVYLYVHEDCVGDNSFEAYEAAEWLLNTTMMGQVDDSWGYFLYFYPSCFQIVEYELEGGSYTPGDTVYAGQWTVEDDYILLNYDDGTSEYLDLPDSEGYLYMGSLDGYFEPI